MQSTTLQDKEEKYKSAVTYKVIQLITNEFLSLSLSRESYIEFTNASSLLVRLLSPNFD